MKIKTKKARLIVKSIVCIVLALAILVPATMFSLANDGKIYTSIKGLEGKVLANDKLEYYDLEKGVYTSKQVTGPDENGEYTVTIDTYTSDVTYISGSTPPVDIMFLLDNSGSMAGSKGTKARNAIADILDKLVNVYKVNGYACMYSFGGVATYRFGYTKLDESNLSTMQEKATKVVKNIIAGTNTGAGFEAVEKKIQERRQEEGGIYANHKQIVVFLSDGKPASVATFGALFASDYGNTAIDSANRMKASGVDIFCIGLNKNFLEDKDNSDKYLQNVIDSNKNHDIRASTVFTSILSSGWIANQSLLDMKDGSPFRWSSATGSYPWTDVPNYFTKSERSYSNSGKPIRYYQGSVNSDDQGDIAESINNAILDALSINYTSKSTLLGDYSVKDTVSGYFEIVPNSAQFYKVEYTGMKITDEKKSSADYIEDPKALYGATKREFNEEEKTPLSLNYTATASTIEIPATKENSSLIDAIVVDDLVDSTNEKHSGNKLRITYKIRPKDSFMGGSSVPTHDYANSGIYKGNEVVQSFDKANSTETNPVPKMSVELVRPTKITANSNVKIGFLYPAENVGNTDVNVTYQGRYSENGAYNSYIMNADSGIVYDKDGTEISYGSYTVENDKDDNKSESSAASGSETGESSGSGETNESAGSVTTYQIRPSDYACLMYGKASKAENSVGVVDNGLIQFNSTGISLNGTTYSSTDVTVNKIYYLGWSEYNQFDKYGNNTTVSRFENYAKTGIDSDAVISDKLNAGIAKYSATDNLMLFVQGQRAVEQFTGTVGINVHVPTVTVNDAVWTTAVGEEYQDSSADLSDIFDNYCVKTNEDGSIDNTADTKSAITATKNFVPTTINTTEFKLPTLQGGKITYTTTASDEFIAPIEEFSKDIYVVSYVKGYTPQSDNLAISDGDRLKIALEYVNADNKRIINTLATNYKPSENDTNKENIYNSFKYTFDAFEAINQCSYCANSYTPQFLGYSAQVHKETKQNSKFITVKKEGAYDDTDSFVFGVYGYKAQTDGSVDTSSRKLLGTFVVHGNNTQTVSVTMAKDYQYFSVEENLSSKFDKGWSWNYSSVDVSYDGSAQVSDEEANKVFPIFSFANNNDGANVMLTFKNTHDTSTEKIASDSTWCINVIKSDSITRMTEDGTETFAKAVTENTEVTTVAE